MDYGCYFVNGLFYDTQNDVSFTVKDIALSLGFQLTHDSHKKNPREEEKCFYLYCSHGGRGKSQSTASSESSRTSTT